MVGWRILLWAVLVLTALLFLYMVRGILPPFIMAFVIASLLEPVIRKLRLRGLKKGLAISIVFVCFFLVFVLIGLITVPRITEQVAQLDSTVSQLTTQLETADTNENFFIRWNPAVQAMHGAQEPSKIDRMLAPYRGTLERIGLPSTRADIMRTYITPNSSAIAGLLNKGVSSFLGILAALPSY